MTLTVEADPDCLLSEAGDMTYFRFTLKNTSEEDYVFNDALTLRGSLDEPKLISGDPHHFRQRRDGIHPGERAHREDEFDRELAFQLTWQTDRYAEEDEAHEDPIPWITSCHPPSASSGSWSPSWR